MIDIQTETVSEILVASVREVFSSMLGSEATESEKGDAVVQRQPYDGVLSFVGLAGSYVGNGSISCSAITACDLASRLLMSEAKTVDDEVLDAVGELTNMIVGSAKNQIEDRLGPIQMSIPTSVYGKNISMRSMKTELNVPVRFLYDGGEVLVSLCLAEAPKNSPRGHMATLAEV